MKIIIRYYNEWGVLNVQSLKISSKYKVSELYEQVSNLTGIQENQLRLILINLQEKIVLDELSIYISNYQIQEGSAIFAQNINDPFSDMASSFHSQFDPSEFLNTSANSSQDQETFLQLIRLSLLTDIELFLEDRNDKLELINGTEINGWNALHLCVFLGNQKLYLWLLGAGGDITILSKDGWNCLQLAIWQQHFEVANLILGTNQIDVNQITKKGTVLHIAAEVDDPKILELLLRHPKLDITIKYQGKTSLDIAGEKTKPILQKEMLIMQNKQFGLLNSYRESICSFYSLKSFFQNRPEKPPIIKGMVKIVSYFKLLLIDNYLLCDPDSGVLSRFKNPSQFPMNPNEVSVSKNKWFQDEKFAYIEIQYFNKHIHLALTSKSGARQWLESIKNSIGYCRYINNNLQKYQQEKQKKTIYQIMMEKQNQEIDIFDIERTVKQNIQLQKLDKKPIQKQRFGKSRVKLKDFQILSMIGKGTFGNVYKVIFRNKILALKQQQKQKALQEIKYIQSETNIMKQLNSPFIVKLHHTFQTQSFLYLVMDYCENGDLTNYITKGVVFEEEQAIFIIAQVILAIEYLHQFNIIYRDLKPENVVVDKNNYIKLIDFGLSKETFEITNTFCGSPAYLSPELLNGVGVSQMTDIYTIGLLLYEMLHGYPPFYSQNMRDLLNGIQNQDLKIPKSFSQQMKNFLQQIITKEPNKRLNFKQIKNHVVFAQIDWKKLENQQYQPPKLKRKEQQKQLIQQKLLDKDYSSDEEKPDEIFGWDYSIDN